MESPFKEHLNTNYIPTDSEIEDIHSHLVSHEAELERLNALLSDLSAQRDRLQDYVDSHKALISHARRLPQDILEIIFLECLPTGRNAVMAASDPPQLLCHICSAWRFIALSMPGLWMSLHIPAKFVRGERIQVVTDWLERSAPFPLTLSLQCTDPEWELRPNWTAHTDNYDMNTNAFHVLARFSDRWKNIVIHGIGGSEFLEHLASVVAPLLSYIKIVFKDGRDFERDESYNRLTGVLSSQIFTASDLHSTTIYAPKPLYLSNFGVLEHFVHLTLARSEPGQDLNPSYTASGGFVDCYRLQLLLRGCTRLVSLRVHVWLCDPGLQETILAPRLESLILLDGSVLSPRIVMKFMEHLSAPNLVQLHLPCVDSIHPYIRTFAPGFLPLLAERFPLISDLRICLPHVTKENVMDGLSLFPSLIKLSAVNDDPAQYEYPEPGDIGMDTRALLDLLTPHSAQNLCPALQELALQACHLSDTCVWMNFLQAHLDYETSLRRLEIELRATPPAVFPDLSPFLSCGLDVSLTYTPTEVEPARGSAWAGMEEIAHYTAKN
ncbi:hypothetical protein C8R43DRAFT_1004385 [Mycena crocata]|nr:hypothetical protein C8R43DRAFT_1004385 [Mycena crocata]